MAKITAPFTPEQVEGLNAWQRCEWVHPFTCGNDRGSAKHRAYAAANKEHDFGILRARREGWYCPVCGYAQDWAHEFMLRQPLRPPWGAP
jgi:hypothetical protein